MGIPIESRLSKAALAKRQRSAALRKTRTVLNYVASEQTTSFGMYQQNLSNLISHARENPPQSARLLLVSKDLSSPAPISSTETSIIHMLPLFMRRGRYGRELGERERVRARPANRPVHQPSSPPLYNTYEAWRRRHGSESVNRAQFTLDFARRTILHMRVSRMRGLHAVYSSHLGHNISRHVPTLLPEAHSLPLSTRMMRQERLREMRRIPGTDIYQFSDRNGRYNASQEDERHADGRSTETASPNRQARSSPTESIPSARPTPTESIPSARPTPTESIPSARPTPTESIPSARPTPTESIPSARPTPTESIPSARPTDSNLMSDKAISMLYEVDHGCVWELGCWVGTQHFRTTEIFGILIEVLEKTSEVPGSPVEALCIQDNLFSYSTVRGGVSFLKELSGQLHDNYDRSSNYFVHPMNDQHVQIIVSP